jgi:hypothetical protein
VNLLFFAYIDKKLRPYSKSSLTLTLNEWRFNLGFSRVSDSMLFLNSWRVSSHIVRYNTSPPAIQKQQWHSREAQIELPLIECECEWAFRIYGRESNMQVVYWSIIWKIVRDCNFNKPRNYFPPAFQCFYGGFCC